MVDVKMNYKSKYVKNWKCRLCGTEEESYSHLFTCKKYGEDIKEVTKGLRDWTRTVYLEKTQKDLERVAHCISEVLEIREENLTRRKMNT